MSTQEKARIEKSFTAQDEEIIFLDREHIFVLAAPLFTSLWIAIIPIGFSYASFSFLAFHNFVFIASALTILALSLALFAKTLIDWAFHVYIVTNKKLLEVWYRPLFSETINDVLLDQVRCTEIDIQIHGIINELLDLGDIILTFDRPTHQEYFSLKNITHPRIVAMELSKTLGSTFLNTNGSWIKTRNEKQPFRFIEEIVPGGIL